METPPGQRLVVSCVVCLWHAFIIKHMVFQHVRQSVVLVLVEHRHVMLIGNPRKPLGNPFGNHRKPPSQKHWKPLRKPFTTPLTYHGYVGERVPHAHMHCFHCPSYITCRLFSSAYYLHCLCQMVLLNQRQTLIPTFCRALPLSVQDEMFGIRIRHGMIQCESKRFETESRFVFR